MMAPTIGLNTATIAEKRVPAQILLAAESGFPALGLWARDFGPDLDAELAAVRDLLRQTGLLINELCFLSLAVSAEAAISAVFEQAESAVGLAEALGCPVVVALPAIGSSEDLTLSDYRSINRLAASRGITVALEFAVSAATYNTLEAALPLAEASGMKLLVDTFHFLVGGSSLEALRSLDPEQIGLVHISDAEDHPLKRLREVKHDLRTYPGHGIMPVVPVLDVIGESGYSGSYSVEIWNRSINSSDSAVVARRAWQSVSQVLREARITA